MEQVDVILGVDTHLEVHVGAVISQTGKLLGTLSVSARTRGYLDLLISRVESHAGIGHDDSHAVAVVALDLVAGFAASPIPPTAHAFRARKWTAREFP